MSSRPTKKRALIPLSSNHNSTPRSVATSYAQSPTPASSFLNTNIDASILKVELEHERSMRSLDAKRAQHKVERLENMIKFKEDELEGCKKMLEEEQHQGEVHLEQMRKSRDEAVKQLRELQRSGFSRMDHSSSNTTSDHNASLWQRKHNLLKSQNEAKDLENEQLKMQLRELRAKLEDTIQEKKAAEPTTPTGGASSVEGQSSPAPSDLMHELNRVRIKNAEKERENRQLRRASDDWHKKYNNLLPLEEKNRSNQIRVQKLEVQLKEETKKLQTAQLQNEEWQKFGKALLDHFPTDLQKKKDFSTPPEVTTIVRQVQEIEQKLKDAQHANLMLEQRVQKLRDIQQPTEERMKAFDQKEATWKDERKVMEHELHSKQRQIETLQQQEGIWKRERASYQELIETFDKLPLARSTGSGQSADAKLQVVELELNSTKEELQLVKTDRSKIQQERQELQNELERVKEKYGKLREALQVQKGKAQEAEARATRAEELSGKGSFNPEETKVLHLTKNPRSNELEATIVNLRRQLEVLRAKGAGGQAAATPSTTANVEVDPDKLHQRLKESFKEQIGVYRESVYLMTGWKIDMIPNVGRTAFRVRSMFGEKEEDQLMLKWPKLPEGDSPSSLDMMSTDWATALNHTASAQYMKRYNSLPAFLASVQLSLFENQTLM